MFKGKRVLVTGNTGFKGSWLCLWLNRLGADVYGFALPSKNKDSNFNICHVKDEITQMYGDVRASVIRSYIEDIKPEFIFHLAAQPIVLESFKDPAYTFETNVMGTVNVLNAARDVDCLKSIVVVTSDKCYKDTSDILNEDDSLGGDDPYSASKACEDIIASSFYKSFFEEKGIGLSTVRAGNVVGGGDVGLYRIVPDCIKAIDSGENIKIRNPKYIRPWQYVLEPLYGYLKLAAYMYEDPKKFSSAWNFGPEDKTWVTVYDLAKLLIDNARDLYGKTDSSIDLFKYSSSEKEKSFLSIDSSKAGALLGVKNLLDTEELGRFVIEDYFCSGDIREQRLNRIEQYEEKVINEM